MKPPMIVVILIGLLALLITPPHATAHERLQTSLTPYEEVPSVSSTANGEFRGKVSNDETSISWSLAYSDLEGAVQQAHIHFGQAGVNDGITVFLCTNLGNGPVGTQPCPAPPTTITGTITAADVSANVAATLPARTQGIGTGEFAELLAAIRAGVTYVNVHSTTWPGGELRGQLDRSQGR